MAGFNKARTALNSRQLESSRAAISVGMIISRLTGHVEGRVNMSLSQIQAAKILLDKALPNLQDVRVEHNNDQVTFRLNMGAPKLVVDNETQKVVDAEVVRDVGDW